MPEVYFEKSQLNICCIGAGYVGGPTMVVIADNCPDIIVNVVDIDKDKIDSWNDPKFEEIPIFEPNLIELLKRTRGKNLFFSTNIEKQISNADIIFISVNTPTKTKGIGAGRASDLIWVEACARDISKYSRSHTIVVEKSTVPVKTAEVIKNILNSINQYETNSSKSFSILSNPEFLAEGSAINDLQCPDRVLIGGDDKKAINTLASIYERWVAKSKIIKTNIWSSELSKLTANAFLAQRISSINSISAICEKTGASINEVSNAIGLDQRIGNKFLSTGPGFGGSCFNKDILNLSYLCEYFGLKEVAEYWDQVLKINDWQKSRITYIISEKLFGNISRKRITILGFAFKANTNDTRFSPAINICKDLIEEGAILSIHDPKVSVEQIRKVFNEQNVLNHQNLNNKNTFNEGENWNYFNDYEDATRDSDAILILTEWGIYKKINWKVIFKKMRQPSWIFDTRLIIEKESLLGTNFNLWQIGN